MVYTDDYSILDTAFIVHATPIDPCAQCDEEEHSHKEYLIGLILACGDRSYQVAQTYPTRALRDAAFEAICALVQQEQAAEAGEEE